MARLKKVKETLTKENDFYGLSLPEFKNIKVNLESKVYSVKLGDEVLIHDENFSIRVNVENIVKSEILKLNDALNLATGRTLYLNKAEFFSYYTYDLSKEEGLNKFNKIKEALIKFDNGYNIESLIDIKKQQDVIEYLTENGGVKDHLLSIHYSKEREEFYIVALDRIGIDEFKKLASNAKQSDKVKFTFLQDILDKKMQNKSCFIYSKNDYEFISKTINELLKKKEEIERKNTNLILTDKDKFVALNYDKKNHANFFIEFSEEEGGFYFYLKGYKQKSIYRNFSLYTSSLEHLIRELVVIQDRNDDYNHMKSKEEIEEFFNKYPFRVRRENHFETELNGEIIPEVEILKDKSKRMRWFVPASSYKELKLIYDNFLKNEIYFTRKVIKEKNTFSNSRKFIVPFIDEFGNCFISFEKEIGDDISFKMELTLPEFKNLKALLIEKDIGEMVEEFLNANLFLSTKHLVDEGSNSNFIIEEAYRRAELKYTMEGVNKKEVTIKRKKI